MTLAEKPAGGPSDDNDQPGWSEWYSRRSDRIHLADLPPWCRTELEVNRTYRTGHHMRARSRFFFFFFHINNNRRLQCSPMRRRTRGRPLRLFTSLPLDVLLQMFYYCDFFDTLNLSAVSESQFSRNTCLVYPRLVHNCKPQQMNIRFGFTKSNFYRSPFLQERLPRRRNSRTGPFLVSKWMYVGSRVSAERAKTIWWCTGLTLTRTLSRPRTSIDRGRIMGAIRGCTV